MESDISLNFSDHDVDQIQTPSETDCYKASQDLSVSNKNETPIFLSYFNGLNLKRDTLKCYLDKKDPDKLHFPSQITSEIGLSRNEVSFLKKKGCRFYGRKTTINWVRVFLAQKAEEQAPNQSSNLLR